MTRTTDVYVYYVYTYCIYYKIIMYKIHVSLLPEIKYIF